MTAPKFDKSSECSVTNGQDRPLEKDAPSSSGMTRREAMSVVTKYSAVAAPMMLTLFPGDAKAMGSAWRHKKGRNNYGSGSKS